MHKESSAYGKTPTEYLLHSGRVPQTSKGKPISLKWGGGKDKCKKGDKGIQDRDLHPRDGVIKEEKFPHTKVSQARSGDLWNLRGAARQFSEEKWRKFTTEDHSKPHL